jgi:hypothetical protein
VKLTEVRVSLPAALARAIVFAVITLGAIYALMTAHQHFGGNGVGICLAVIVFLVLIGGRGGLGRN